MKRHILHFFFLMSVQDINSYLWLCIYTLDWISEDILAPGRENKNEDVTGSETTLHVNKKIVFFFKSDLFLPITLILFKKNNAICENVTGGQSHTHTHTEPDTKIKFILSG